MLEENELSSPPDLELKPNEQLYNHSEQNDNDPDKEIKENEQNTIISDIESSEKNDKVDSNIEVKNKGCLNERGKSTKDNVLMKYTKKTDLLQQIDELDDQNIHEKLQNLSENELLEFLKEVESINFYLSKENEVYEFILNDEEIIQSFLGRDEEINKDMSVPESFELTYSNKCYFANKKLEHIKKALKQKNDNYSLEIKNLKFELESLNKSLKDLNESKEKFNKNIRIDGRHPVTKKIVLQKLAKYFDDSIRAKMDLANRYKIQMQSDIIEQNKILNQIKAQEKRLAFLDMTEFQEAQFEYKKSCRQLAMHKEQLGQYKAKFSHLLQKIAKLKKDLQKEENDMEQMKNTVIKLEHLKEVMLSEKARNDEKVKELKAAMRKIKLDPRRHNLPEVIDYAAAKRENVVLTKSVEKWGKKVQAIQQEKLLHLNALTKKKRY